MKVGDIRSTQDPNDPFPPIRNEHYTAEVVELKDGWVRFNRGIGPTGKPWFGQMKEIDFLAAYPKEVTS